MELFQKPTFNPEALLTEHEIHLLGSPESTRRIGPKSREYKAMRHIDQHRLLSKAIEAMEEFQTDTIIEMLDRENDLHGLRMSDEMFQRAFDNIYESVKQFKNELKELDRLLVLYHVIAENRAMVWYPPRGGPNNEVFLHQIIDPESIRPFNYIIHTYCERETALQKGQYTTNAVIFNKEAVRSLNDTAVRFTEHFCLGEMTDLDRQHFQKTRISLSALNDKLAPYLQTEGIDTGALDTLLKQPNFDVSLQKGFERFEN